MKIDAKYALSIFKKEIAHLKEGIKNSQDPYHYFSLSTINKDIPQSCTIVLRSVKEDPLKLYFNTDKRSNKTIDIIDNPSCCALFYNNKRRTQLRLNCIAILHNNNNISSKVWKNTPMQSRKCYMAPHAPSSLLKNWEANLPKEYIECDPTPKDSEKGYKNFCCIELKILSFEIIELKYDGHIRFKVDSNNQVEFLAS